MLASVSPPEDDIADIPNISYVWKSQTSKPHHSAIMTATHALQPVREGESIDTSLSLFLFLWEWPESSEKVFKSLKLMLMLPVLRSKSPVILLDHLQLHPRDLTLCSLWVYMKFHKREALHFHINIFIWGKNEKCQYISNQFPTALKNVKYSCEHLLIPPSEIYFPFYLACRLHQLEVVQSFH